MTRRRSVLRTELCDLLGIEYPILQAGMGRSKGTPTPPPLVAAVSEAGGLGCLGGMGLLPEDLRGAIREVQRRTAKPFGVDLILPVSLAEAPPSREEVRQEIERRYPAHHRFVEALYREHGLTPARMAYEEALSPAFVRKQVEVVLEERVPVFVAGLGDPAWLMAEARRHGITVMGLAGSVRNALRQKAAGVDVVIAQGYEAGGHTGSIANFALVPQVVDAVAPTPVVAAGGIAEGRQVVAALALGAVGVWCGTAFLFAEEAGIAEEQRRQLEGAASEDLVVSRSYTGKPARSFRNEILRAWAASGLDPLPMPYQTVLMDDFVETVVAAGRWDLAPNPAGQVAGMLRERKPAAEILRELVDGAVVELERLGSRVTASPVRTTLPKAFRAG